MNQPDDPARVRHMLQAGRNEDLPALLPVLQDVLAELEAPEPENR